MTKAQQRIKAWLNVPPGHLVNRGHPAGDFLEAYDWIVHERKQGFLRIEAHLPQQVKNIAGQLFGGFTPTYVDFVALFTVRAGEEQKSRVDYWLATSNMRVDYFEPVNGPRFIIESTLVKQRKRMCFVETRFLGPDGKLLVFALTTIRKTPVTSDLADA